MSFLEQVSAHITQVSGHRFSARTQRAVGGGCISSAYVISDQKTQYFLKTHQADRLAMFTAEASGLHAIAATGTVRCPRPICYGTSAGHAYLVMEYVDLRPAGRESAALLGARLAALHRHTAQQFGFETDNTLGATPQPNAWQADWIDFYRDQRLGFQVDLAARNGFDLNRKHARLSAALPALFSGYRPSASLLHGDLWGGNWGSDPGGEPVIFDPACYFGDREADLAMTELFGGFPSAFYAAYAAAWPLDRGYTVRKNLYNLYHLLNHFNLFGGGYRAQAERCIDGLLAEIR